MNPQRSFWWRFLGACAGCFILSPIQHAFLPYGLPSWAVPDLLFIWFLFVASRVTLFEAVPFGMVTGFLAGALSGSGGPLLLLGWGLLAFLLPLASQGVYLKDFFPCVGYVGTMFVFSRLLNFVLFGGLSLSTEDFWWRLLWFLPLALITAFLGPVVFFMGRFLPVFAEDEPTVGRGRSILFRKGL